MSPKPSLAALGQVAGVLRRLTRVPTKEAKYALGVDIGSAAVKAVALGPRKGASARPLLGQEVVPLSGGPDANPADAVKSAVGALKVPTRTVTLSVSGPWVIMRVVELPRMKADEMKQALPFEAQRYLPFNIEDVIIDGVALGPADDSKDWVLIVACKKELIERRLDCARAAGLDVAVIDVDALALTNSFLASRNGDKAEGVRALVDVGLQLSNLVVFKDQMPYLVRDIPWGAEKLARAVADQTGTEAAAVAQALSQGDISDAMRGALPSACEPLVTELQLSFDYFENRFGHAPADLLATGGLSQCGPFIEALKGHVAQAVVPWTPLQGLSGQFSVAYGLALRGAG